MKRIFISGPYTVGDVAQNVKLSMDMANYLIEQNFAPFCPHLTHFLHMNNFQPYEKWLEIDLVFLEICDAVIRLPGESNGADKEIEFAKTHNIPVFYDLHSLKNYFHSVSEG
jgi:hypothetical protein